MYLYSSCMVFAFLGFLRLGSVLATPLGGIPGLGGLAGLTGGLNGNENGQPSLPAADSLGGLTQLGGLGNVAGIDIDGLLSGLNLLPRDSSNAQYINSDQISTEGSCNVGTAQCCQSLQYVFATDASVDSSREIERADFPASQTSDIHSQFAGGLLTALIPLDDLFVGVQCSPIANVLPVLSGAGTCQSRPVCCSGNTYEGLINLGCSPISL